MKLAYFDAHCDTLSRCLRTGESLLDASGQCSLERLSRYEPFGQVFAIFADSAKTPDLRDNVRRQAALFRLERERNPEAMRRAALSVEGGELLDCDPERLDEAKAWGVRAVNLTWNHVNALSGSHAEAPERGLSDVGRAFVRRAAELGIFMDVSHLSDRGFFDVADMGLLPLLASHSNSRTVCPHTRNLTDDQFKVIRDSGGFVGVNLYRAFVGGDGSMEALLRHFDRFLDMDGAACIGLGSDWDGGITGAGNLRGVEDMVELARAMERYGYGKPLIRDIFYGNLSRFLGIE
ncbi:MAG: membrane dipeptidase [Oscillibacter sp.]|nr:membrane dipeptidase [Oscillibacter sp.]